MACASQVRIFTGAFLLILLILFGNFTASVTPSDTEAELETTSTAAQYQKPRRFLQPWMCRAPGPACLEGMYVSCKVGGKRGCICSMIHLCHPEVSGCFMHNGKNVTSCGF
ncbi:hypothetical protein O6H91_Y509200 [Diphasiastrum complanatum]|nr:hypothetical protein O6H91_Y509200 [Diphasiastrum complanatum]